MPTDLPTPSPGSDPDDSLSIELFRKSLEQPSERLREEEQRLHREGEIPRIMKLMDELAAATVTVELKLPRKLHGCLQEIIDASPNTYRWHDDPIRSVLLALIKSGLRTEHDLKTSDFS